MKKIEGIIFDWAGTTVDFGCFAPVDVFIRIFKEFDIYVTLAEAREPMGMSKKDHVRAMLEMPRISEVWYEKYGRTYTEEDVSKLYAIFEAQLMDTLMDYTTPIKDVCNTVKELRARGIKIGSTTGYTREMIELVATEAAKKGYTPDAIVTADDTNQLGRPYPYMIFRNMIELQLSSVGNVMKVGDTISDIKEAKAAGVSAIGVIIGSSEMGLSVTEWEECSEVEKQTHIQRVEKKFKEAGATYTIASMDELVPLIDALLSKENN